LGDENIKIEPCVSEIKGILIDILDLKKQYGNYNVDDLKVLLNDTTSTEKFMLYTLNE